MLLAIVSPGERGVHRPGPAVSLESWAKPARLGEWHGTRPGMTPPRAFAIATSTGRPESSFARPGQSVSTGTGGRPVQSGAESTAPAGLRPRGTRGCCSGSPARSCCGSPAGSSWGCCSSYRPGSPGSRPWPSTASDCKTRLRQRQLDVEPARVKATRAVARCCNDGSSSRPAACSRSSQRSLRRKRTRLASVQRHVARVHPASQEIHPESAAVDVRLGLQTQGQLPLDELADAIAHDGTTRHDRSPQTTKSSMYRT